MEWRVCPNSERAWTQSCNTPSLGLVDTVSLFLMLASKKSCFLFKRNEPKGHFAWAPPFVYVLTCDTDSTVPLSTVSSHWNVPFRCTDVKDTVSAWTVHTDKESKSECVNPAINGGQDVVSLLAFATMWPHTLKRGNITLYIMKSVSYLPDSNNSISNEDKKNNKRLNKGSGCLLSLLKQSQHLDEHREHIML